MRDPSPVAIVREVIERSRPQIPGELDRDDADIADMFTVADKTSSGSLTAMPAAATTASPPTGSRASGSTRRSPQGSVQVQALLTASPEAHAAIWRYLLDLELAALGAVDNRPLDDPIRWLLAEWRHYQVKHSATACGCRCSTLGGAGGARLSVPTASWCWIWRAAGCCSRCATARQLRAHRPRAEIELDPPALASTFLGGYRFTALRDGERLRELEPGACVRADSMFRAEREPWCSYEF